MKSLQSLRIELRDRRKALSRAQQQHHADAIRGNVLRRFLVRHARHVALYLSTNGEPDTRLLVEELWRRGASCYLPVLAHYPKRSLQFQRYHQKSEMRPNRFCIPEPVGGRNGRCDAMRLDLVLMPLVGFDDRCNRLGMGGGYYDRTFAFLRERKAWKRPLLIGLAHECQRVEQLEPRPWDVPLAGIVTEKRIYMAPQP